MVVESSPSDMIQKIAKVLRDMGYETVLISLVGKDDSPSLKDAYNKRIFFGFTYTKVNLRNIHKIIWNMLKNIGKVGKNLFIMMRLKPYIAIGRSTPNWLCLLTKKLFRKSTFVYYPYDIRSFGFKSMQEAIDAGIPKFEMKSERYCFEHADGIIHTAGEDALKLLDKNVLGKDFEVKAPVISFLPYCIKDYMVPVNWDKLSKKEGGIQIVYVGHVAVQDDLIIGSLVEMIKRKVHVHLYVKTNNLAKEESYTEFLSSKYKYLADSEYLHLHPQVDQGVLAKEISKYDYGIWLEAARNNFISTVTGNKAATYFEACLPFVYFRCYEFVDKTMKDYDLDLGIEFEDIKNLNEFLKSQDYNKLVKNTEIAREDYEMHKQIGRLIDFFDKAVEFRKSK